MIDKLCIERVFYVDEKLYDLCDWAEIEAIVYSEHDNPHHILGAHVTDDGILINAFFPGAKNVDVKTGTKKVPMELADEEGFFAVLINGKKIPDYKYIVTYTDEDGNDKVYNVTDPYSFEPVIDAMDMSMFSSGIHYDVYNKLGSHVMTVNGTKGVLFAVWAPHAMRVSVVGNFNEWDGRFHQMRRLGDSGIHELFIPGVSEGAIYKYEIKVRGDYTILKSDPYAYQSEELPSNASVVTDIDDFKWTDSKWISNRADINSDSAAGSFYEVHLGTWKVQKVNDGDEVKKYSYKEIAPLLADYVKEMGYTHIQLLPIMEYADEESLGYNVTGYYEPTSRYGSTKDFMFFMNYMHEQGIGVIIDWNPAFFGNEEFALEKFDGKCLYEHEDPKNGIHPEFGTNLYNYGQPQVTNFLIANAMFWVEKFHVDGIRIGNLGTMLYSDYKRKPGEWIPNMYGGNENLEGIEFIKHLNSMMKKKHPDVVIIANDEVKFDKFTQDVDDDGLGFSYKWNSDFNEDMKEYLECDPLFRKGRHNQLTFGMVYAYSEKYMLALNRTNVSGENESLISTMPGEYYQKFSNVKATFTYSCVHPGKKLIFMGQDMGQYDQWNKDKPLDWNCLNYDNHIQINTLVRDLNKLYKSMPALHKMDYDDKGFEWINDMDSSRSIISFLRKTDKEDETLLVVCNFTPVVYENYIVGVPFKGRYKEVFNSDAAIYGGADNLNSKLKNARKEESDGKEYSISITVPPLGVTIFTCSPVATTPKQPATKEEADKKVTKAEKKAPVNKVTTVKTTAAKTTAKEETVKEETVKEEPVKEEPVKEESVKKTSAKKTPVKKTSAKKTSTKTATTKATAKTQGKE